jgi:uncharacterized protein (DUF433 family)
MAPPVRLRGPGISNANAGPIYRWKRPATPPVATRTRPRAAPNLANAVAVLHSPPGARPGTLVYDQGMSWPERIVIEPEVLAGKPVVRGTRLAVEFILELLAAGQSEAAILANYPGLTRDDILACLAYASYLAHEYKAYPVPV